MSEMNVFQYSDYKTFLKEYAERQKKKNPAWSFGRWARSLQLSGTSALTMVINGDRHPSKAMTMGLCDYFHFNDKQKKYFIGLVHLKRAQTDPDLQEFLREKLSALHPSHKFRLVDHDIFAAISKWYFYALREMVLLKDFHEDSSWIQNRLNFELSKREINEALKILEQLKFLQRSVGGRLLPAEPSISTSDDIEAVAITKYHEQITNLAKNALQTPVENREYGALTLNIRTKDLQKIKTYLRKVQSEFCEQFEAADADETYTLAIQLFPITKSQKKLKKEYTI